MAKEADESDSNASNNSFKATENEDYGYYFYPQRSGSQEVKSFWASLWSGKGENFKCEANVTWCVRKSEFHHANCSKL